MLPIFAPASTRAELSVQDDDPPRKTYLQQAFPNPTGDNGYEELMMAADSLRDNVAMNAAQGAGGNPPTLAMKRRALTDPNVFRALNLVRAGLSKQIVSPQAGKSLDAFTVFPQYAPLRSLARALNVAAAVKFADSRPAEGLTHLFDTLTIGAIPKPDVLIGLLVGIAVDTIALTRLISHVEMLSHRDCERVLRWAIDQKTAPDSAEAALSNEAEIEKNSLRIVLRGLKELNGKSESERLEFLRGIIGGDEDEEPTEEERRATADLGAILASSERLAQLDRQLAEYRAARLSRDLAALKEPWREPPAVMPLDSNTFAGQLSNTLVSLTANVVDRAVTNRIHRQFAGIHAAIQRFRLENDRLPKTLDDLATDLPQLRPLLIDAFSNKPLLYERVTDDAVGPGAGYKLESIGPVTRDDDGNPVVGSRSPVRLPIPRRA